MWGTRNYLVWFHFGEAVGQSWEGAGDRRGFRTWPEGWRGSYHVPSRDPSACLLLQTSWSWHSPSPVQLIICHPGCTYHVTLREIHCTNRVKTWWPGEGFRAVIKSAIKVKVDGGKVLEQRPKWSCKLKRKIRKKEHYKMRVKTD